MSDESPKKPPESGPLQIQLTFTPQADGTYTMRMDYSTPINPLALPTLLMTALAEAHAQERRMLEDALKKLEERRIISPQDFLAQQRGKIVPN